MERPIPGVPIERLWGDQLKVGVPVTAFGATNPSWRSLREARLGFPPPPGEAGLAAHSEAMATNLRLASLRACGAINLWLAFTRRGWFGVSMGRLWDDYLQVGVPVFSGRS